MVKKSDLKIETFQGQGSGGQHRNRTYSCVRITHIPTGISATQDGRNQHQNKRAALKELQKRLDEYCEQLRASKRKERRDVAIKDNTRIRTYDFTRGLVTDHRSKKTASLKDILEKGLLSKL